MDEKIVKFEKKLIDVDTSANDDNDVTNLLDAIFEPAKEADTMSDIDLKDWAQMWGLPNLSCPTLRELYQCGLFEGNPWTGVYNYVAGDQRTDTYRDTVNLMRKHDNLMANLDKVRQKLAYNALNCLMNT